MTARELVAQIRRLLRERFPDVAIGGEGVTRDEIMALPAGRALDALVAEKVLGCKVRREERVSFTGEGYTVFLCGCTAGKHGTGTCAVSSGYSLHEYSTRISYAWEVLDALSVLRAGPEKHPDFAAGIKRSNCRHAFYKPVIRLDWYEHDGIATAIIGRCKSAHDDNDDNLAVTVYGSDSQACMALALCRLALLCVTEGK